MINNRVVPLFSFENMISNMEEFQQAPQQYASAIYSEIEKVPVLFTAGHVADFDNLCIGCDDASSSQKKFNTIDGTRFLANKVNGNFDKIDWGVIWLCEEIASFCKRKFRTYSFGCDNGGPYTICGYPNSLNRTSMKTVHFEFTPQVITGLNEASEDEYKKTGYSRDTNIVLKKNEQKIDYPKGMSGGPILDKNGNLVAIFTDYKKFFIGTRIPKVLSDLKAGSYLTKNVACEESPSLNK